MAKKKNITADKNRRKKNVKTLKKVSKQKSGKVTKSVLVKAIRIEKNYSVDSLQKALDAVKEGLTLRAAAQKFNVPKSTLFEKLKNKSKLITKKGSAAVLTEQEESQILEWILSSVQRGFPVTKTMILDCVQKYIVDTKKKNPFKNNRPGKHWYNSFIKRHGNLHIKKSRKLKKGSVTEEDFKKWFTHVKEYLGNKNLLNINSERIFNLDETSIFLDPEENAVSSKKEASVVNKNIEANEKESTTVIFTAAASGKITPPMILFDSKKTVEKEILDSVPKDWGIGKIEGDQITAESFYDFIVNIFFKWLKENQYEFPVIIYLSGQPSNFSLPLLKFCKENQIELIALFPNASHIMQPLDVEFFHAMKGLYRIAFREWRINHNVIDFKNIMFPEVLQLALQKSDFTSAIQKGFKTCGLLPFDPDAVDYSILSKHTKKKQAILPATPGKINTDVEASTCLKYLETNLIDEDILKSFREHESLELWTGDISQKALFSVWHKLKKSSGSSGIGNQIIYVENA